MDARAVSLYICVVPERETVNPILSSLRLEVVQASHRTLGTDWARDGYSDDVARLYWVERGLAFVRHHDREFQLRPGRLYLIPAGTTFDFWCPRRFTQYWVHFTATSVGGLDALRYLACEYESAVDDVRKTRAMIRALETAASGHQPADVLRANGLLMQLLAHFPARAEAPSRARADEGIRRFAAVLGYVEANLGAPLRVSRLAAVAHLERTYFARAFRARFGVTPARYVQRLRLDRAKRMLLETDLTLRTIADRNGYTDVHHFAKSFKKLTGTTPGAFRRQGERSP